MQKITPQKVFSDERGKIESIVVGRKWMEVNRVESKAGVERGKHYHKETDEFFYMIEGVAEFTVTDSNGETNKVLLNKDQGLIIERKEIHSVKIIEDTVWLQMLTKQYDNSKPDMHSV